MPNVQLSKYKDFQDKKILVIDDFPEFRTAIKRMVEAFGALDVDTTSNGEDATNLIGRKHYDIILCDYNLGDGKDGQQILEEAKYKGTVLDDQIFILLTAENTAEMVMGALEYEPDGYLVKPFTKEMVHQRLFKTIEKKLELNKILQAIHKKDLNAALAECEIKLAAGGALIPSVQKMKGKLLLQKQEHQVALQFYNELLATKKATWMLLGRGKCHYFFKDYEKALLDFQEIVTISCVTVEGYDWIAKAKIGLNDLTGAQETLQAAVKLSPKAILRQQLLADIAVKNQDFETAEKAYRAAVLLGKNSCYRRVEDSYNYAQVLIDKAQGLENGRGSVKSGSDAIIALESLFALYPSDKIVQTHANILLILAYKIVNKADKSKNLATKVVAAIEKDHIKLNSVWLTKFGNALNIIDEPEQAKKYLDLANTTTG